VEYIRAKREVRHALVISDPSPVGSVHTMWAGVGQAAVIGIFLLLFGAFLYISRPYLPQKIADGLNGFYTAVLNKYYVDELYARLFVKPLIDGSTSILWQGVDRKVIDDTVNNAADGARVVSDEARHMQSGNLRSYAGWIAAGSAVVIAYMIWMGVR